YIEVRLAPGLGWQRIDYGIEVVTTTPDGRVYYIKYYGDDHLYWYNWRTGERGSLPAGAVNIERLIPYEFINVKERFISKTSVHEELTNAVWRPDTDAYYVYLHDHTISGLASIEDELRDKRVTFIGLGTNTNKHQIDSFTEQLGHGTYIDNTNLNAAISELAAYLISQAGLPKYDENKETVILEYMEDQGIYQSGKLVFEDNYEDIENDPKVKERWMFRHDPDYYEQPLG